MPSLGAVLKAAGQTVGGYAQDRENAVKQAVLARQQARQEQLDTVAAKLSGANVRHLDAESAALENKAPKVLGHIVDPTNGTVYVQYEDGTYEPAKQRPAAPAAPVPVAGAPPVPKPATPPAPANPLKLGVKPTGHFTFPVGEEGIMRGNTDTGELTPTGHASKPTLHIESATNTAAKARLESAVSEMNNAHKNMTEFEGKLSSGEYKIGAGAQVLGRVANAFTHDDPLSQLTQSGALAALNSTDPDLARYIRRGLSFAEGESMVSQRPSDFRTKMAAFLSTAASGASPEMIADIQGRRTSILNPLNATVTPTAAPSATKGTKTLSKADAVRAAKDPNFAAWARGQGYKVP